MSNNKNYGKEWRKKNAKHLNEYHKKYYKEHKDEYKLYRDQNREKINKRVKEYYKNNPVKYKNALLSHKEYIKSIDEFFKNNNMINIFRVLSIYRTKLASGCPAFAILTSSEYLLLSKSDEKTFKSIMIRLGKGTLSTGEAIKECGQVLTEKEKLLLKLYDESIDNFYNRFNFDVFKIKLKENGFIV
jgi:hypothetical protein